MSDETERGAGAPPAGPTIPPLTTVPIVAQPARPPGVSHRATQMSASAVPSTLESPKDALILSAEAQTRIEVAHDTTLPTTSPMTLDDINGTTLPDNAARDAALHEAMRKADAAAAAQAEAEAAKVAEAEKASAADAAVSTEPSTRRQGPPTMMSPTPGQSGAPPPPLTPENAVVDAILPPAAFAPPPPGPSGSGGAYGSGNGPPQAYGAAAGHAQWGTPGAHPGAFDARDPRHGGPGHQGLGTTPPPAMDARTGASGGGPARKSNTTMIVLIVVGAVVLLGAAAAIAGGALLFSARKAAAAKAAKAAQSTASAEAAAAPPSPASGASSTGAPGDPGRAAPRNGDALPRPMGGGKARISTLATGPLDIEGVRSAVTAVLPRVDACFAASELEPPNHENAAYDLDVTSSGIVTRVEPASQSGRAPKLDACVGAALKTARLPKSGASARVRVSLSARIADLQQPR